MMTLKAIITTLIVVVLVAGVIYFGYAALNGQWPFSGGTGDGDGEDISPAESIEETSQDVVDAETHPPILLIEIRESTIIYADEDVTLDELETIFQKHNNSTDIWILQDTYRADKSTYDSVKELLEKWDMVYREQ